MLSFLVAVVCHWLKLCKPHDSGPVMLIMWLSFYCCTMLPAFSAAPNELQSVWPVHCRHLKSYNGVNTVEAGNNDSRKTQNLSLLPSNRHITVVVST